MQTEKIIKEEKKAGDSKQTEKIIQEENNVNDSIQTKKTKREEMKTNGSIQTEKTIQEEKREDEKDVNRLIKELEDKNMEFSKLKQELETMKKSYEVKCSRYDKEVIRLIKDLEDKNMELSTLKLELETMKKTYGLQHSQLEAEAKDAKGELKKKSQEYEHMLENLRNKVKESEAFTESKYQKWIMKEKLLQKSMSFQFSTLQVKLYMV